MKVHEIIDRLSLEVKTVQGDLDRTVTWCYIGDLLSDVMANAKEGEIWITHQTHPNIVAVAVLKNLSGIILANRRKPEEGTLKKAEEERMMVASAPLSAFEAGGILYQMLRC
jgi:hypothetical protein